MAIVVATAAGVATVAEEAMMAVEMVEQEGLVG